MRSEFDVVKQAAKLALKARQAVKNGDFTPFIPVLAFAIAKDCLFDIVPIVGKPFSIGIAVYVFIFMWGRGKWKVRIFIFFLSLFDLIPGVNLLPFTTICVLYGYYQAKRDADKAKKELSLLDTQTNAQMIREYQMARAMAASEEAANDAEYDKRQAANDAEYQKNDVRKVV